MAKRKRAAKKATAGRKRSAAAGTSRTSKKAARPAAKRLKKTARKAAAGRKTAKRTAKTSKRLVKKSASRPAAAGKAARSAKKKSAKKAAKARRPAASAKSKSAAKPRKATSRRSRPKATVAPAASPVQRRKSASGPDRLTRLEPVRGAIPSSLSPPRGASAAKSGREEMLERTHAQRDIGPAITAGDVDANWDVAYSSGDEAPGGDNPTPDQDVVDEIGRALGIQYDANEELKGAAKLEERDKHRWELDPASAEDYPDHEE